MGKRGFRSQNSEDRRVLNKWLLKANTDQLEAVIKDGLGADLADLVLTQLLDSSKPSDSERETRLSLTRIIGTLCTSDQIDKLLDTVVELGSKKAKREEEDVGVAASSAPRGQGRG